MIAGIMMGVDAPRALAQLQPRPTHEPVVRGLDPRFDRLVAPRAVFEKIADNHGWAEGPVWVRDGGYLLFSLFITANAAVYRIRLRTRGAGWPGP